jgi:hypothetical protein
MRRQHIVIGGDDTKVRRARVGQRGLVLAHRGIGMGLVAAGQMAAGRACRHGAGHPLQIGGAGGARAGDDPVGDLGDSAVQGHRASF